MFSGHGARYLLEAVCRYVYCLSCKAHKRSHKAFVKVHRGVGRGEGEKPLRAYLSTEITRSLVWKYGRAAHSGVVIHIR